jgi:nucleoside-diphosphate kinase
MGLEKTLVLIKPDGIKRGLVGEIIKRIERTGLKIISMKMSWIDQDFAEKHYSDVKERYDKRILDNLVSYITEGPVIAICFEGVDAISLVRKIVGATYPNEANPGTIRGDFCHISKDHANKTDSKVGNLIHASSDQKDAEKEIKLWFSIDEMHSYKTSHQDEVI